MLDKGTAPEGTAPGEAAPEGAAPSPEDLRAIFDSAAVGIVLVDGNGVMCGQNPAFHALMQNVGMAKLPAKLEACLHREDREALSNALAQLFSGERESISAEMRFGAKADRPFWGRVTLSLASNHTPADPLAVAIIDDITERKRSDDHLSYLASHDALTGLPNRTLFAERLERALARAKRNNLVIAVLFLDLDHFKQINDTHGHATGDALLKQVAKRIGALVRREDTVARLSGDEFTVILEGIGDFRYASTVVQKILQRLAEPFDLDGKIVRVSSSIGVALYPADGNNAATLVRKADKAMYVAKKQGRGTFRSASVNLAEPAYQRDTLMAALRKALTPSGKDNGLDLYFQPVVHLSTGAIIGAEALLRWNHAEIGLMTPSQFLPLAAEAGLVPNILKWVLGHALKQIASLTKAGHGDLRIAVNLSRAELSDPGFLDIIGKALKSHPELARSLDFDIPQSCAAGHDATIVAHFKHLHQTGARLSLDDFSGDTLNPAVPVDMVKLSPSLTQIALDSGDHQPLKEIITSFRKNGTVTIAKAVENSAQMKLLKMVGCEAGQGYLLGRPVPGLEFLDLIARAGKAAKASAKR